MIAHSLARSAGLALLALSCTAVAPQREAAPMAGGEIALEIYSGFTPAAAPKVEPAPVHLLVDITPLMTPELADGAAAERLALARTLAGAYLQRRTELTDPQFHEFHRMGPAAEGRCSDPRSGSSVFASRALEQLQKELTAGGDAARARVVLLSSFQDECVPRLCEAAAKLVQPGAWLDVVAVGADERPPPCLADLRPAPQAPIPWLAAWSPAAPPSFSVEAVSSTGGTGNALASGSAGGPAVAVSAGLRRIRVALTPPELIGPIRVRPGDRLRVRLLDFPLSAPGERTWVVETVDDKP